MTVQGWIETYQDAQKTLKAQGNKVATLKDSTKWAEEIAKLVQYNEELNTIFTKKRKIIDAADYIFVEGYDSEDITAAEMETNIKSIETKKSDIFDLYKNTYFTNPIYNANMITNIKAAIDAYNTDNTAAGFIHDIKYIHDWLEKEKSFKACLLEEETPAS